MICDFHFKILYNKGSVSEIASNMSAVIIIYGDTVTKILFAF